MSDHRGVTHYDQMPIPPVEAHTRYFDAGLIRVGVEYRLLDDAITAASAVEGADGTDPGVSNFEDCGVSLHVFGNSGGESREYLRFDCFDEDPHYHYIDWNTRSNHMVHMDREAIGDPVAWSLERSRSRLAPMLERAGAGELAQRFEAEQVEAILAEVEKEAQRARIHHDPEAIRRAALGEES